MKEYLIGEKLSHSYSVPIHKAFGAENYSLKEIGKEELAAFFAKKDFGGLNVTIPYKREAFAFLDEVSPLAERIGAVNTVVNRGGVLYGDNTDYFGFLKWEGGSPLTAFMTDVPRHAEYEIGDTIVTSGHSTVFIEGIPVGTVASKDESDDEMSFTLEIHLFTDFGRLNDVYVMALPPREELKELAEYAGLQGKLKTYV